MMKSPALIPELYCTDIKNSLNFYVNILGFKILYDRPEDLFAMIERQGAQFMLEQPSKRNRSWMTAELQQPFGRGINFQIETTDINSLYQNIQNTEAHIFLEIEEKYYRFHDIEVGNRQFIIQDPDGYLLRFFEDLGERPIQTI